MGDIADVVCAFCGSIMGLGREVAASADTHALRFFSCETCGAGIRDQASRIGSRISLIPDYRPLTTVRSD